MKPFLIVLLLSVACFHDYVWADSSHRNSIPRSTNSGHYQLLREAATADDTSKDTPSSLSLPSLLQERPPWNPSPKIDETGFVSGAFTRFPGEWESEVQLGGQHQNALHLEMVQARIRQVPGDGNCLFHSISTCMAYADNNHTLLEYPRHLGWLYRHSAQLRQQAVDCLRHKRKVLFLQGNEYLRAHDLVEAAAAQYGISAAEYCDLMQQDSYWGGGPEIVALCNVLKRPIHVYELAASNDLAGTSSIATIASNKKNVFVLRRMACFGSPKFDKKEPFHILSADSRFPDVSPGKQLSSGNHFLAIFPLERQRASLARWIKEEQRRKHKWQKEQRRRRKRHAKKGVRGGGGDVEDDAESMSGFPEDDGSYDDSHEFIYHPMDEFKILEPQQRLVLERARIRQRQERMAAAATSAAASKSPVKSYLSGLWKRLFCHDE